MHPQQIAETEDEIDARRVVDVELAAPAQDIGEIAVPLRSAVEAVERGEGLAVGRLDGEQLRVMTYRGVGVVENVLLEGRELAKAAHLRLAVVRVLDPVLVELAEIGGAIVGAVETVEHLDRFGVSGIGREDLLELLDGVVGAAELFTSDGRQAAPQAQRLVFRGLGESCLVERDQRFVRPCAARRRFERLGGLFVRRGEGIGFLGPAERRLLVGEPVDTETAQIREHLETRLEGGLLGEVSEQDLPHGRHARPFLVLFVDGQKRRRRADVVGTNGEHPLLVPEGAMGLADAALVDLGGAHRELDLELRVLLALGGAAEHVDQPFPILGLGVERLEAIPVLCSEIGLAQGARRPTVAGIEGEDALPGAGGLRRLRRCSP